MTGKMTSTSPPAAPSESGYIRGGGGREVDAGRVVRLILGICFLALLVATIFTAVTASHQNSRADRLRKDGRPVTVTVTSCTAFGSGVGETIQYYSCRGTYALDGRTFNEVIGGARTQHARGASLAAIAVPGDPSLVTVVGSTESAGGSAARFVPTIVLGALAIVVGLGLMVWMRARRRA